MKNMKLSFCLIILIGFTNAYAEEAKQPMHPLLVVGETILFPALPNYQTKQYTPAIIQTSVDVIGATIPFFGTKGSYENLWVATASGVLVLIANRLISIPFNIHLSRKAGGLSTGNFIDHKRICLTVPVSSTPGIMLQINY